MQDSKKISVRKLGAPGTVDVDLLPEMTAGDVLRQSGAGEGLLLSPAPQLGIVYDDSEQIWDSVTSLQTLFAAPPTPVGAH